MTKRQPPSVEQLRHESTIRGYHNEFEKLRAQLAKVETELKETKQILANERRASTLVPALKEKLYAVEAELKETKQVLANERRASTTKTNKVRFELPAGAGYANR